MKTFRSWEKHELEHSTMFLIRRPDGWAEIKPGEVPMPGEVVEIDGAPVTVERAEASVGSFNWRPHIVILVAKPTPLDPQKIFAQAQEFDPANPTFGSLMRTPTN